MSQRGGDVQSNLRISSDEVRSDLIPQGPPTSLFRSNLMEALRYLKWLAADGWIVTNTVPFKNIDNYPGGRRHRPRTRGPALMSSESTPKPSPGSRLAPLGQHGALRRRGTLPGTPVEKLEQGIRDIFARKGEQVVEQRTLRRSAPDTPTPKTDRMTRRPCRCPLAALGEVLERMEIADIAQATIRQSGDIARTLEQESGTEFLHLEMGIPDCRPTKPGSKPNARPCGRASRRSTPTCSASRRSRTPRRGSSGRSSTSI